MNIKGVIFDMDGLLIDSEPIWEKSEIEGFNLVGIKLDNKLTKLTTGLQTKEVIDFWYNKYPWDLKKISKKELKEIITDKVLEEIIKNGKGKKGYEYIFDFLNKKNITKIAIASSSDYSLIEATISRLNIKNYIKVIYSAQDEKYGKPHPGVYINACEKLGLSSNECIAFEDSLNGIISAKSAKIKCVSIPEKHNLNNPKFAIADIILKSLNDFGEKEWNELNK